MTQIGIEVLEAMYETAATIRRFEQRAIEQYRLGNIRGYLHPYLGEEGIAVGSIAALEPDDYIVSTHRGHGHALAKGHEPGRMMAELFGRRPATAAVGAAPCTSPAGRSATSGPTGSSAAGSASPSAPRWRSGSAAGPRSSWPSAATARRRTASGTRRINLAAIWDLPVIFVLENNQYAVSTPIRDSARVERLALARAGLRDARPDGRRQRRRGRLRGDAGTAPAGPSRRRTIAASSA